MTKPDAVIDRTESQVPEERAITRGTEAPISLPAPSVDSILAAAVDKGMSIEVLGQLVALKERLDANAARKAFFAAMAAFKAECPTVPRRTENPQFKVTRNGTTRVRMFASLEDIEATIREPLGRHGLSFRWGDMAVANGVLTMACIVSHEEGHSESSAVSLPVENRGTPQRRSPRQCAGLADGLRLDGDNVAVRAALAGA